MFLQGADVAHPSPQSVAPSIASELLLLYFKHYSLLTLCSGLVGSNDATATAYATEVRVQVSLYKQRPDLFSNLPAFQPSREEIIVDLQEMALKLIRGYYKKSKQKPARILFYRDGVR